MDEVVRDCSTSLQFSNNQFIAIMHNDTGHQHVHIVANRIGFDGKTVSDSNNYKRISDFCRSMEEKHQLKKVSNPVRYLPKKDRHLQRQDNRKQQLKDDIRLCLEVSKRYVEFEQKMRSLLRATEPSDLSLMNLYLMAMKNEDYETCATAKSLLLERGVKIQN